MISPEIFESAFNVSPMGEYILTPDATVVAVNDTFLELALRSREEMIGRNLFEIFPSNPEDPEDTGVEVLKQSLARVVETGKPDTLALQRYPIWVTLPDGTRRYEERFWSVVNTPIFDSKGDLLYIAHSTMDVTEMALQSPETVGDRPEAEHAVSGLFTRAQTIQQVNKALEEERGRLRHLFEHAPGFVYFTRGPEHMIEQANDTFHELVGRRDFLGKSIREAFPEIIEAGFLKLHDEVYRTARPYIGKSERVMLRNSASGPMEEYYLDLVYQPILDAAGAVIGICGQGHDITEQKRFEVRERAYARRQAFKLQLSDSLRPLASFEQIIWTASEMLGRHLGVPHVAYWEIDKSTGTYRLRQEWSGSDAVTRFEESGVLSHFGPEVAAILKAGSVLQVDDVRQDKRTCGYVEAYDQVGVQAFLAIPLVKAGELTTVLSLQDTLPRSWNEDDIRLVQDVAERTWSAVEAQRAHEELQEESRRKDEFLAMLAHELRNPLAPISAAADLMQVAQVDPERVARASQVISRQVAHMTALINDLLDVSRVTRGLVEIRKTPQDVNSIVASAVEQVRPLIDSQRQRFTTDLASGEVQVAGDRERLVQIVTNLLNNAAKYTPAGGEVHLSTSVQGGQVTIQIKDNGIGIEPDLQSRVFQLFTQADRGVARSQGGLGLGLALVKSLVKLHQGKVTCFSEGLGKGSTFTVILPQLETEAQESSALENAQAVQPAVNNRKILVVDDNADAASMLAMLLETSGYEVIVEHSAKRALERARIEEPEACLLDIGLPDMDGTELARLLRAEKAGSGCRLLIAVTGYGQAQDRKRIQEAGFDHHLVKPVETSELLDILQQSWQDKLTS